MWPTAVYNYLVHSDIFKFMSKKLKTFLKTQKMSKIWLKTLMFGQEVSEVWHITV
jgi:hypothetical protein